MLCANTMPCSNNASLQQGKRGFDCVRVDVAEDIRAFAVVDGLVSIFHIVHLRGLAVDVKVIGHEQVNIFTNIFLNVLRQSTRLHILSMEEAKIATALSNTYDDFLFTATTTLATAPSTAHIGLVHLHDSPERLGVDGLHGISNAMAQIPCRAIVDAQHPLKLICGHTLARLADQERREEPLNQRQMCVMKHRVSRNGELVAALFVIAVVLVTLQDAGNLVAVALGAANAIAPAQLLKVVPAGLLITKPLHQFAEVNSFCHEVYRAA